jgi:hypothetical protein
MGVKEVLLAINEEVTDFSDDDPNKLCFTYACKCKKIILPPTQAQKPKTPYPQDTIPSLAS